MDEVRLAVASMNSVAGDIAGNIRRIIGAIEGASEADADILCLPEMCLTGYSMPGSAASALDPESPEVWEVVDAVAETDMVCSFGFAESGGPWITQVLAGPDGVMGTYRKTHLGEREADAFLPGDALPVFRTPKAVIGIQLCWEAHFPEITCTYALKGADIVLMPHASGLSPERRKAAWDKVLPARAYDNTVYLGACNAFGSNGAGVAFGGGAAVIGPRGDVLAEDYGGACIVTADLDPEPLDRIRSEGYVSMRDLYFLDKRRPDIYYL